MKRTILFLTLLLSSLGAFAYSFSAVAPSGQTLYYNIVGEEAQVTSETLSYPFYSTQPTGALEIPPTVINPNDGSSYTVTSIGNSAFKWCNELTSVIIPNTVVTIYDAAFSSCNNLASVIIPESVTTIYATAFYGCKFVYYCGTAPGSPWGANMAGCFFEEDGFLYEDETKTTLKVYIGTETEITIPNSVTAIGDYAFAICKNITSVTIPNSVTTIGNSAFQSCSNLSSVTFGESVTTIGNYAFNGCTRLSRVDIPNSVTTIGNSAFEGCRGLASVTIGNSVTIIGSSAFYSCSGLTSVTIGNSVTTIGSTAFRGCTVLTSVTIPNSVTSIGSSAFYGCSRLTSLIIPNSVITIGDNAFMSCSGLTNVSIGNSVTNIGSSAFMECTSLTSVIIPNSVTTIGTSVFYRCSSLTSAVIPGSVTSMGNNVFYNCNSLNTIYDYRSNRSSGTYGRSISRIVLAADVDFIGTGANQIVQIKNASFTVGTAASNVIPMDELPVNYIASDGSTWKARKIVLTDGNAPFSTPVNFTANTVEFDRSFYTDRPSTVCLPFVTTTAHRTNFKLYDFSSYENGTAGFTQVSDNSTANRPYIIEYNPAKDDYFQMPTLTNVQFSATPNAMPVVTYNNFNFVGTLQQASMSGVANRHYYGLYYGYFVEGGSGSYDAATVNPFRSYFYTDGTAARPTGVDLQNEGEVGIELVDPEMNIQYSNDVYDLMGRCVRKNADSLRGLPKGIYIWKGKKMLNY